MNELGNIERPDVVGDSTLCGLQFAERITIKQSNENEKSICSNRELPKLINVGFPISTLLRRLIVPALRGPAPLELDPNGWNALRRRPKIALDAAANID